MNILIVGASKGIGLETVQRALAAGHRVKALARSAASIEPSHPNLERLPGSALDRDAVKHAMTDCDAVILTLGASNPLKATRLFSDATRIVIDAMKDVGIARLIVVTGLGAGDSRGKGSFLYAHVMFPLILKRIYDDKDIQEQMVRASGLDWTIVRPGILTTGRAKRSYRVLTDPKDWTSGSISRADVADFLVSQLSTTDMIGKTPVLIN